MLFLRKTGPLTPVYGDWFWTILGVIFQKNYPPPTVEKMRQFYAFRINSLFIMILGLFLDKILFDWTLETPTYTSTKFATTEWTQQA